MIDCVFSKRRRSNLIAADLRAEFVFTGRRRSNLRRVLRKQITPTAMPWGSFRKKLSASKTVIHEGGHAIDGTASASLLREHLKKNTAVYKRAVAAFLNKGYSSEYFESIDAKGADKVSALEKLITKSNKGETLTDAETKVLQEFEDEWFALAVGDVLDTEEFARQLIKDDLNAAEKLLGKMADLKKALTNKKSAAAKEAAAFVKRTEQLYIKHYTKLLTEAVAGKEPSDFNFHTFSGEVDLDTLASAIGVVPFMSEYNCVLVTDIFLDMLNADDLNKFKAICKMQAEGTVLILSMPSYVPKRNAKAFSLTHRVVNNSFVFI